MVKGFMIVFRFSIGMVLFLILSLCGISLPWCFGFVALLEIIVVGIILITSGKYEEPPDSILFDLMAVQYTSFGVLNIEEMIHTCGARVLAMLLGFYAVWLYIPTIIIYLTTCMDIKKGE
jgi:hypothetical protein